MGDAPVYWRHVLRRALTSVVSSVERPLTAAERNALADRRNRMRSAGRSSLVKSAAASMIGCAVLASLTIAASDAPTVVIVIFWTVMAGFFALWAGWSSRKDFLRQAGALDAALGANRARETRILTRRVVEFEEIEDEGACYAFDAGDGRTIFITGQEFYADDTFPNSDVSIVEVLTSNGLPADVIVTMSGERIAPERIVPAAVKARARIPDHLEIVPVPIDRVGVTASS